MCTADGATTALWAVYGHFFTLVEALPPLIKIVKVFIAKSLQNLSPYPVLKSYKNEAPFPDLFPYLL